MLYRTLLLIGVAWILVTGIVLSLLVIQSWQELGRFEPLSAHIEYRTELDSVADALVERFFSPDAATVLQRHSMADSAIILNRLSVDERALTEESKAQISSAAAALEALAPLTPQNETTKALADVLTEIRNALVIEREAHQALLHKLADYGERQLLVSVILALLVPAAVGVFLIFFRRRVLAPLDDLGHLIGLLSRKDYSAAIKKDVDPLLAPLFDQYNRMVKRMRNLNEGHVKREDGLQRDVEQATRVLFQQQTTLARAERMAVIGDMSARLAHDLRNPLSGVLMALTNLRGEMDSAEQCERLGLAIGELERITRLLNNVVDEARLVPERPRRLQVSQVVGELARLLRYQLGENIEMAVDVPQNLHCKLPEAEFRHVLFNLVANAGQAIGNAQGKIAIRVMLEGDRVRLSVCDNGPGFPRELLDSGIHGHGTWRRGSIGLGLAAVRRFALAHGGALDLENRKQGGAEVILTLPLDTCEK